MQHEETCNGKQNTKSWRASSGLALFSMILSISVFIATACMTAGELETKPTQIILKGDACGFLRQNGIATTDTISGSGSCSVTVPYRANSLGSGGLIVLANGPQIKIPDSEVVIVGSIENGPWTPSQNRTAIILGLSSIFMASTMIWFFRLIFTTKF